MDPVTSLVDAMNARRLDRFLDCFSEDAVIEDAEGTATLQGRDAIRRAYGTLFTQSDLLQCEARQRMQVGPWVIEEQVITGANIDRMPYDQHMAVVYRLDGDKITHVRVLPATSGDWRVTREEAPEDQSDVVV